MKTKPTMLWVPRSKNAKTGDIPQGYVGATKQEAAESCDGCPLYRNGCYHWQGTPSIAHTAMTKAHQKDSKRYTLRKAIKGSVRSARYARGAVGGDPWVFDRETVAGWIDSLKSEGIKGLLLYTHFAADKGAHLKGLAMASVHSLSEADDRIREGWRAAMVADFKAPDSKQTTLKDVPTWNGEEFTTPDGHTGIVCPAQYKAVDCNTCGLCDAKRPNGDKAPLIVFLKH